MTDKTALGDRMKQYEAVTRAILPRRTYTIVRVDGRAFHTYLRSAGKPFDQKVADAMDAVAVALCEDAAGAAFAYTQSDEASVLLADFSDVHSEPWFGGGVQKIASISAAIASVTFNRAYEPDPAARIAHPAVFDARVFTIPSAPEVANYFLWRQRDATRNSISMAAQTFLAHRDLQGVDSNGMQELLWSRHKVNWNDYPDRHKRGGIVVRVIVPDVVTYTHKRTGAQETVDVTRTPWRAAPAPRFSLDEGFLPEMIPELPAL